MSALDLDAIEARASAATPGPWVTIGGRMVRCKPNEPAFLPRSTQDAAFIAEARTDVPALCSEMRRLREVARVGWETARALAIQYGARGSERAADEALLRDIGGGS